MLLLEEEPTAGIAGVVAEGRSLGSFSSSRLFLHPANDRGEKLVIDSCQCWEYRAFCLGCFALMCRLDGMYKVRLGLMRPTKFAE